MWLIQEDVLRGLSAVQSLGVVLSPAQIERFEAMAAETPEASGNRIRSAKGATAEISIEGVLTERPSMLAMMLGLGGTSYQSIRGALAQIDADPGISDLVMNVNSPGGHVDGLFETLAAVQAFSKPIKVRASNAQSAAYALAAAAGPIEATGPAATFGSVGIVAGIDLDEKRVQITNTESPLKRPDVTTAEGKGMVREQLDALHELFVGAIAEGRNHAGEPTVNVDRVKKDFGRGATVLADKAKSLKMIDTVPPRAVRAVPARRQVAAAVAAYEELSAQALISRDRTETKTTAATSDGGTSRKPMNREEIRAQFPAVYEAIVAEATAAGKSEGETKERKRVSAHLTLGTKCGAMDFALKCIAEGKSTLDEDVHAEYIGAAANRSDQRNRQADSDDAAAAADGAAAAKVEASGKDFGDEVAAEYEKNYGTNRKVG